MIVRATGQLEEFFRSLSKIIENNWDGEKLLIIQTWCNLIRKDRVTIRSVSFQSTRLEAFVLTTGRVVVVSFLRVILHCVAEWGQKYYNNVLEKIFFTIMFIHGVEDRNFLITTTPWKVLSNFELKLKRYSRREFLTFDDTTKKIISICRNGKVQHK